MTTADQLLTAILNNPQEETPRLILADWCDENDQPERANFIRTDSMNVRGSVAYGRYRLLAGKWCWPFLKPKRVTILRSQFSIAESVEKGANFCASRKEIYVEVRHGFVISLCCSWRNFARYAGDWFSMNPICHVVIWGNQWASDTIPKMPQEDDYQGRYYRSWYRSPRSTTGIIDGVHRDVFSRLKGWHREETYRGLTYRCYNNNEEAHIALSQAFVEYGRDRAANRKPKLSSFS